MKNKVTVCIPTFNSEETIGETLESLINQTYKDVDIIVFDNASTDRTLEVVREKQSKKNNIIIKTSPENIGAEANFTRCMQHTGDGFVAIFHADDVYKPNIIEKQVALLEKTDVNAVACHALRINLEGKVLGERFIPNEFSFQEHALLNYKDLLKLVVRYGNFITCPSVMCRAKVLKEEIKIWNGQKYKSSADLDVWLRIAKSGGLAFITEPLVLYREDIVSTSFRLKRHRIQRHDLFLVLDELRQQLSSEDERHLKFLELKDDALRIWNGCSRSNLSTQFWPWKFQYICTALATPFHLKFFIKIVAVWLLSPLKRFFA